jgi:hypothetical protein
VDRKVDRKEEVFLLQLVANQQTKAKLVLDRMLVAQITVLYWVSLVMLVMDFVAIPMALH